MHDCIREYNSQVKVKVKFTLEQATKAQRESKCTYSSSLSLTSALDEVGCRPHASAALPVGKRPGTHCTGGWVGPRDGLNGCGISRLHRDSVSGPPSP